MATVDELFETMEVDELDDNLDTMFVIDPVTRMVSVPESEMIFGVESDSQSEKKRFLSPRYVGNNIDLSACFLRVNYRNANGDIDSYLVNDLQIVGNDVVFSWELHRKVTEYKGFVQFVVCAGYANREGNIINEWNTTVAMGTVLEGIEPTIEGVAETTSEVITQLLTTVANQTANVEAVGDAQVTRVEQAAESARIAVEASIEAKGTNTLATIPEDYTRLSGRVDVLDRSRAPGIVCEAEGSTMKINDASDLPFQGLRVFGRSMQGGIPTPSAPVEIDSVEDPTVSVFGKNLVKPILTQEINGSITATMDENGAVTLNGTSTGTSVFVVGEFEAVAGETYVLSGCPVGGGNSTYRLDLRNTDTTLYASGIYDHGSGIIFKVDETQTIAVGARFATGVTFDNKMFYPMVRLAEIENGGFESYSAQTIIDANTLRGLPVTINGNYTDDDGRLWVCDEIDFGRGVFVKRIGEKIFDGTEDWALYSKADKGITSAYRAKISDMIVYTGSNIASSALCNYFEYGGYVSEGKATGVGISEAQLVYLRFDGESNPIKTVETLKSWLADKYRSGNPVKVYYVLRTPVEIPLSLAEINSYKMMTTNSIDTLIINDKNARMNVAYVADTKTYINNLIKEALS